MIVFFRAKCVFTKRMPARFWRKARKHPYPFLSFKGVGGGLNGYFSGMFPIERKGLSDEEIAYEVAAAVVDKVEMFSPVGVDSIDFDEITLSFSDEEEHERTV